MVLLGSLSQKWLRRFSFDTNVPCPYASQLTHFQFAQKTLRAGSVIAFSTDSHSLP